MHWNIVEEKILILKSPYLIDNVYALPMEAFEWDNKHTRQGKDYGYYDRKDQSIYIREYNNRIGIYK